MLWSSEDYAEHDWPHHTRSRSISAPCGIIPVTALCVLCRYRHKTHATGHPPRLDRIKKFADRTAYAFEELVAELGNVILCTHLGLTPDFEQSAAYVESWLKALKEDKRAIFRAAAEGQKAADLLIQLAGPQETEAAA